MSAIIGSITVIVGIVIGYIIAYFINKKDLLNRLRSDKKTSFIEGYFKTVQDLVLSNAQLRSCLQQSKDFKNRRVIELQNEFYKNQKELITYYVLFARVYISDNEIYLKTDNLNKLILKLVDLYNGYLIKKIRFKKFDEGSKDILNKITKDIDILMKLLKEKNYLFKI